MWLTLWEHTQLSSLCWVWASYQWWRETGKHTAFFYSPWWWRFVVLNVCKNCFQVSPLCCGACGLPITQCSFWEWSDVSRQPGIRVNDLKSCVSLSQSVIFSVSSLPQVSLLEYRKRKQGSGRDLEPVGNSSSLGGTPTRPGSHYSQDSHHPHSQQMQPPASPQSSSFSSSAHTPSIPQIEEVSPPDHQGSSGQPRRQDSNNQWWGAHSCSLTLRLHTVMWRYHSLRVYGLNVFLQIPVHTYWVNDTSPKFLIYNKLWWVRISFSGFL